jgi:hypothetical protein
MQGGDFIDPSFDMRSDAGGKDPDSHSRTLRRYHRLLWSKPLPSGAVFDLDDKLHHQSELGEFWLSSDSIAHTYSTAGVPARVAAVAGQLPPNEVKAFRDLACTIGGYLVFPMQVKVDGKWRQSINQARGMHPKIGDRFDLTLECIRRQYLEQDSPLGNALAPYGAFFDLFGDFPGYVQHFLLQDFVSADHASVRFSKDFDDFSGDPLPAGSVAEYREYMKRTMDLLNARNERIAKYASGLQSSD